MKRRSLGAHLAIYDTVAAPKSLLPRSALRTQSDVVFLCELGALCGEELWNSSFDIPLEAI
jgi:hypothetical protein